MGAPHQPSASEALIDWLDIARGVPGNTPRRLQRAAWAASLYGLPAPKMKEQPE